MMRKKQILLIFVILILLAAAGWYSMKKTGGKDFKLSEVFDGLNMQMLIYLMCLWDNGKDRYGKSRTRL